MKIHDDNKNCHGIDEASNDRTVLGDIRTAYCSPDVLA